MDKTVRIHRTKSAVIVSIGQQRVAYFYFDDNDSRRHVSGNLEPDTAVHYAKMLARALQAEIDAT